MCVSEAFQHAVDAGAIRLSRGHDTFIVDLDHEAVKFLQEYINKVAAVDQAARGGVSNAAAAAEQTERGQGPTSPNFEPCWAATWLLRDHLQVTSCDEVYDEVGLRSDLR
nr:hypothetical protein HK105_002067 [Polyrhizophydium stewartii]